MPGDHQYGDAPIEPRYMQQMQELARFLDKMFNGKAKGAERKTAFVLLVFPFGDDPAGRCNYISNGVDRRDMVSLFREQAARFEGQYSEGGGAA